MASESDLEDLIGKHVFAGYTYRDRATVVRGLVLEVNRGRLKLELTGNGPRFDGKTVVAIAPELQTQDGEVVTAEEHGDLPGLGEWRE